MNFSAEGLGVVSVWINMLRAGENGVCSFGSRGASGRRGLENTIALGALLLRVRAGS
jgi:hypothetical protein